MSSLLDDFKSKQAIKQLEQDKAYDVAVRECPPVSRQLLAHLDKMFHRRQIPPTSPSLANELIFQAGINQIKDYLRMQNSRQEEDFINTRTKED